jgi:hypothetical protein
MFVEVHGGLITFHTDDEYNNFIEEMELEEAKSFAQEILDLVKSLEAKETKVEP